MKPLIQLLIPLLIIVTPKILYAQASDADWMWAQKASVFSINYAPSTISGDQVITTAAGSIYVSGSFQGQAVFDTDTLAADDYGGFNAKYDNKGVLQWAKPAGTSLLTGTQGNTIGIGVVYDTALVIYKYDGSDIEIWTKKTSLNTHSNDFILSGITADSAGNTYATGYFMDSVQLGAYNLGANYWGMFTIKYFASGDIAWVKTVNPDTAQKGICIAVGKDGATYVGAVVWSNNSFSLTKRNANGDPVWTARAAGRSIVPLSVTTDKDGYIYTSGVFKDTAVFGDHILIAPTEGEDYFIAKYTSDGHCVWVRKIDRWQQSGSYVAPIATDKYGNLFMAGSTNDSVAIGNITVVGNKEKNYTLPFSFIVKYDAEGNMIWIKKQDNTDIQALAMDNTGNICAVGRLSNKAVFGSISLTGSMFVGKMTASPEDAPVSPEHTNSIAVYPNPSDGNFTVKLVGTGYTYIRIADQLGRCVYSDPVSNGGPYKKISLKDKAAGIYYLRATGDNISTTEKIIVK